MEARATPAARADAQHPAREEARVFGKEAVLTAFACADVAATVADDERGAVQDAEVPQAQHELHSAPAWQRDGAIDPLIGGRDDVAVAVLGLPNLGSRGP